MNRSDSSSPTVRLFVGLWPDDEIRQMLHDQQALWQWSGSAVPTRRERLHMTLHFLGDWPREMVPALVQGLAVPFEPFTLRLDDASVWHNGIARIGSIEPPAQLIDLHERLARALAQLGAVPASGRFVPHVTLARKAVHSVLPRRPPSIRWAVGGYVLVESDLRPPASYRIRAAYP